MSILGGFYCSAGPAPGQVLGAVRSAGLLDNTVVMFTADHGDLAMEHRQYYKMSMFEGSAHVPLLITGPGLASGLQSNQTVSLVDIYPTVMGKRGRERPTHALGWIDTPS